MFFFQAEDGIRDLTVTGVQTCALPILASVAGGGDPRSPVDVRADVPVGRHERLAGVEPHAYENRPGRERVLSGRRRRRSEERRVGNDCRSRWWRYSVMNQMLWVSDSVA